MSDPIDITSYVKGFDVLLETGLKPAEPKDGDGDTFTWVFSPPVREINFTVDASDVETLLKWEGQQVMKMEQRGKHWFDVHYTADVVMTDLQTAEDGTISATYIGTNINDKTNQSPLARFLRWVLRR